MKKEFKHPAIVLSAHTMGYGVIRSLGEKGIPIISVYYDKEDYGCFSKYVLKKKFVPVPIYNEKAFIDSILKIDGEINGGLLIPTDDATLEVTAKNKKILSEKFKIACADWSVIEKIINKKYTYQIAESLDIPIPKTFFLNAVEDINKICDNLRFPLIIKPIISHKFYDNFLKKFFYASNLNELKDNVAKSKVAGFDIMIQEIIKGDDSSMFMYNAYYIQGEPFIELTAQKVRNGPPIYGNSTVSVSKKNNDIIFSARKILEHLNYDGYCCLEFRKDNIDNKYKFLEINGRYNLSNYLMTGCGLNIAYIDYDYHIFGKLPDKVNNFPENIYWIDIFRDIRYSSLRVFKKKYSLKEFFKPYLSKHVYAIFNLRDFKPFLKRLIYLVLHFNKNYEKSISYKELSS